MSAYKAILHALPKHQRLMYCDSLLYAAKFTDDHWIIGSAYLTVGAAYYNDKQYAKALENYLKANSRPTYFINELSKENLLIPTP